MRSEEEWGRDCWNNTVERLGFGGNPDRLWDAMVNAREQNWATLPIKQIVDDPQKIGQLCEAVRSHLGEYVPNRLIVNALLAMPRACAYCERECWEWCDECGGCSTCCDDEIHCIHCRNPKYICGCPNCKCLWPKDRSN
jgi:hypothetical protein